MIRKEKEARVFELSQKFKEARSAVIFDFTGLNVEGMTELRKRCREVGVQCEIVKNTLAKRAASNANIKMLFEYIEGPTGLAFGIEDPFTPAKVLTKFAKERKIPKIKGGFFEGRLLSYEEVSEIALLPSQEVIREQLLSSINGAMREFLGVLKATHQQFLLLLNALMEKKEKE